jgi:hypothetical protein
MRRLPRHLIIGFIAAWLPMVFLPFAQPVIKALEGIELQAMFVSFTLWFSISLLIRQSKLSLWLIAGFVSPFIGLPIVCCFASNTGLQGGSIQPEAVNNATFVGSIISKLLFGFISAVFLSWIFVPTGILMGILGYGISKLFGSYENRSTSGSQGIGKKNETEPGPGE